MKFWLQPQNCVPDWYRFQTFDIKVHACWTETSAKMKESNRNIKSHFNLYRTLLQKDTMTLSLSRLRQYRPVQKMRWCCYLFYLHLAWPRFFRKVLTALPIFYLLCSELWDQKRILKFKQNKAAKHFIFECICFFISYFFLYKFWRQRRWLSKVTVWRAPQQTSNQHTQSVVKLFSN